MSRRYSPSNEIAHILAEVRSMSKEQIYDTYGIEINEDKTVYDFTTEELFPNIREWVTAVVEENNQYDDDEDDRYIGKWDDDE